MKNIKLYAFTSRRTRRGTRFRESAAGDAVLFHFRIKGMEEKSDAHATAERLRESQYLAFYGGEDARATPLRRAPREESPAFARTR